MKITISLIPGLPKKELVERIHFHQRQGDIAERALGFYLLDLEKRKMCRPFEDGSTWARKHLPDLRRPDKVILLARRLEKFPGSKPRSTAGRFPGPKSGRSPASPSRTPNRCG